MTQLVGWLVANGITSTSERHKQIRATSQILVPDYTLYWHVGFVQGTPLISHAQQIGSETICYTTTARWITN